MFCYCHALLQRFLWLKSSHFRSGEEEAIASFFVVDRSANCLYYYLLEKQNCGKWRPDSLYQSYKSALQTKYFTKSYAADTAINSEKPEISPKYCTTSTCNLPNVPKGNVIFFGLDRIVSGITFCVIFCWRNKFFFNAAHLMCTHGANQCCKQTMLQKVMQPTLRSIRKNAIVTHSSSTSHFSEWIAVSAA